MELKKLWMCTITISTIAFTACTADDDYDEFATASSVNNEIGFLVETSNLTRSNGTDINCATPTNFMVAALDGTDFFFDPGTLSVSRIADGSPWIANNKHQWPSNPTSGWKGLSFYAYMDGRTGGISRQASDCFSLADGASFMDFEVAANPADQADLMYAVAKDIKQSSADGKVSLNFQHALSRISFTAQNNHPLYDEIEILSIELGGVKGNGSYSFPEASTNVASSGYTLGSRYPQGAWTIDADAANRTFSLKDINVNIGKPGDSGKGEIVDLSAATKSDNSDSENSLFMIPQVAQALTSADAAVGAYIKVTAKMVPNFAPDVVQTVEKVIPISVNWKEGKCYTYNIAWDPTPLSFSATIDGYQDVTVTQD